MLLENFKHPMSISAARTLNETYIVNFNQLNTAK